MGGRPVGSGVVYVRTCFCVMEMKCCRAVDQWETFAFRFIRRMAVIATQTRQMPVATR